MTHWSLVLGPAMTALEAEVERLARRMCEACESAWCTPDTLVFDGEPARLNGGRARALASPLFPAWRIYEMAARAAVKEYRPDLFEASIEEAEALRQAASGQAA